MKGVSVIIGSVLVILLTVAAVSVIVLVGIPAINRAKDSGIVNEANQNMRVLDNLIRAVASEGTGSLRSAQIKVTDGVYRILSAAGTFDYEFSLSSDLFPLGTFKKDGNLQTLVSGGSASASQNSTHLILQNEILEIVFYRNGSESSFDSINTSTLIRTIRLKDTNLVIKPNDTAVILGGYANSSWGIGYSKLVAESNSLGRAEVLAHVRSNLTNHEYEVLYTLPASADFFIMTVRNVSDNSTTISFRYQLGTNSSDILKLPNNETAFVSSSTTTTPASTSSQTINLQNFNYTKNITNSNLTVSVGNAGVFYNASDGSSRPITELQEIGQGNWTNSSTSSQTTINFTLGGRDGYDFGIRDSHPGGSFWINKTNGLRGVINISNDFIRVELTENETKVYNASNSRIFNFSFDKAVSVDSNNLITTYGTGLQNKTVYFFDWLNMSWKIWMANAGNSTHGVPDWLDPRYKQIFKWRYEFKRMQYPSINYTFLMTAHDPFVRTFVDTDQTVALNAKLQTGPVNITNVSTNLNFRSKVLRDAHGKLIVFYTSFFGDPPGWKLFVTWSNDTGKTWTNPNFLESHLSGINAITEAEIDQASGNVIFITDMRVGTHVQAARFTFTRDASNNINGFTNSSWVNVFPIAVSGVTATTTLLHNGEVGVAGGRRESCSTDELIFFTRVDFSNPPVVRAANGSTSNFFDSWRRTSCQTGLPIAIAQHPVNQKIYIFSMQKFEFEKFEFLNLTWNGTAWDIPASPATFDENVTRGTDFDVTAAADTKNGAVVVAYLNSTSPGTKVASIDKDGVITWKNLSTNVGVFSERDNKLFVQDGIYYLFNFKTTELRLFQNTGEWQPPVTVFSDTIYVSSQNPWNTISSPTKQVFDIVYLGNATAPYIAKYVSANYANHNLTIPISLGETKSLKTFDANKPGTYFTTSGGSARETILFATQNWKNNTHSFNLTIPTNNLFSYNYTFNSTLNNNFLFSLGYVSPKSTTNFDPNATNISFSAETLESLANSTLTWYEYSNATNVLNNTWNKTNPEGQNVQHNVTLGFNYDGGASGVWHFDEGAGSNVTDASGNGNAGMLIKSATWQSGNNCKFGNCLNFTSELGSCVIVWNSDSLNPTNAITIEAWVNHNDTAPLLTGDSVITRKGDQGIFLSFRTDVSPPLRVDFQAGPLLSSITRVSPRQWHHIVGTYDRNQIKIFIDGKFDNGASASTAIPTGTYDLGIGSYGTAPGVANCNALDHTFQGAIDELRIYPRALTDYEVYEHYSREVSKYYDDFNTISGSNSGKYRYYGVEDSNTTLQPITPANGTVLHLRFNDNSTVNVTDVSGVGNNGQIVGSALWLTNSSCQTNFGGCMRFDGVDDIINIRNLTLGSYFYINGDNANPNKLSYFVAGWVHSTGTLQANIFQHVAVVAGSSGTTFYINGTQVGTSAGSIAPQTIVAWIKPSDSSLQQALVNRDDSDPNLLRIGNRNGNIQFFNGTIDEVLIINRSLSADEIYQLYLGGYNRTINRKIHRVVSGDGISSIAYNLTDHNNTNDTQDYDMRIIFVNGSTTSQNISVTSSPPPACYTSANTQNFYLCSYDNIQFTQSKTAGLIYSGPNDKFSQMCYDEFNSTNEYFFNLTANGPLRGIIPVTNGICTDIGNKTYIVQKQDIPSTTFGTFVLKGSKLFQLSLIYDKIKISGEGRFTAGTHKICIQKTGQEGGRVIVNVTAC